MHITPGAHQSVSLPPWLKIYDRQACSCVTLAVVLDSNDDAALRQRLIETDWDAPVTGLLAAVLRVHGHNGVNLGFWLKGSGKLRCKWGMW